MPLTRSTSTGDTGDTDTAAPDRPDRRRAELSVVLLGLLGTVLLVASSWWTAAVPVRFRHEHDLTAIIRWLPMDGALPRTAAVAGLLVVLVAWLGLGRLLLTGHRVDLRRSLLLWTTPWLFALPYGTRDPWAYAAQGDIAFRGLNPYLATPQDVGGAFAADVSTKWIDTPAPYGPLWLEFGRLVRAVCGPHGVVTVLVYRLPVIVAVLALAFLVPRLATSLGMDRDRALWLAVLNPVVAVLGLGGAHNDLVMVALMTAAVVVVMTHRGRWTGLVIAGVLTALAAAVKAPAVVVTAFLVPLWWAYSPGLEHDPSRRTGAVLRACAVVAVSFGVVFAVATVISGWGLGWTRQLGSSAPVVNWTSVPTSVVLVWRLLHGNLDWKPVTAAMRHSREVGTVLTAIVLVFAWFRSLGTGRRPMIWLSVGLLALIFLGPSVQPWYLCWVLPFLAVLALNRWLLIALVGASASWALIIHPAGDSSIMEPFVLVCLAAGAAGAWFILRRPGTGAYRTEPLSVGD